jgi:hypothetical protein
MFPDFLSFGGGGQYMKSGAVGQAECVGKLKQNSAVPVESIISEMLDCITKGSIRVTLPKKIMCALSFLL